ncbi:hypothetical protein I4U23_001480 [Adineta vaga]|nr:hypothetical protein I4U23_001480 [Adineta vaga]
MYLLLIIFSFLTYARAQQDACSCSCCIGPSCTPIVLSNTSMTSCTAQKCSTRCRSTHSQCQVDYPNGQMLALCTWSVPTSYLCQCACCNTGSTLCTPVVVGSATAYLCQESSCSLSCNAQYPNQCVGEQKGQTIGTCLGMISTTTTTSTTSVNTVTGSSVGTTCSCVCCQSGRDCLPNIYVGDVSATPCTSITCTQACQNQYQSICPSDANNGRTNGTCKNQYTGNKGCIISFKSSFLFYSIFIVFLQHTVLSL